jgi:hypothetical protein
MAQFRDDSADTSRTPLDLPSGSLKPYSCVVCHRRKVKCDRKETCSNCAKANVECIYRPPPPPRRRKRERDGSRGASQEREKSVRRNSREASLGGNTWQHPSPARNLSNGAELNQSGSGRMIMREGNSVYLDKLVTLWPTHWKHLTNTDMHSTLWTSVSHEVCYSRTFRISISFLILVYSSQMPQKSWVMQQMITATMHLKTKRMFHLCF